MEAGDHGVLDLVEFSYVLFGDMETESDFVSGPFGSVGDGKGVGRPRSI